MASRARIIATVLVLFAAIALWAPWQRDDTNSTRRLPDGTTIKLTQVAYQRVYHVRTGNRFRDYFVPILPEWCAKWLGCRYTSFGATNQLSCCLEIEGPAATKFLESPTLSLFDEHGCESGLLHLSHRITVGTHNQLIVFPFYQFPRRAKTIGLRLYGSGRTNPIVAEFIVPNPARREYPQWKPERFPITRRVGSVDFTLLEAKSGVVARRLPLQLLQLRQPRGAYVHFRISEKGKPIPAWQLHSVAGLSDACGHTIRPDSYMLRRLSAAEYVAVIETGLCTEETAWKLQLEFSRDAERVSAEYLFKPSRATATDVERINSER